MSPTVEDYLQSLPEDRQSALQQVRKTILKNLPKGFEEGPLYGMIGYYVPHSVYPAGYHCDPKLPLPIMVLGSKKNYMTLHLMSIYGNEKMRSWFEDEYKKSGKKLNMGAACIQFKRAEDLAMDVIGKAVARVSAEDYIKAMESAVAARKK